MNILALLLPILGNLFTNGKGGVMDIVGQYFNNQASIAQAQADLQKQQLIAQQQALAADANLRSSIVQSTSGLFKERIFWFLSIPIIYTICYPSGASNFWLTIGDVPEWYRTLYATILLTIWGIPVASSWVSNIFSGVTSYMSDRRQDIIVKTAVKAAAASVDKVAFYDALRSVKGIVTEADVKTFDKVLDKLGN